MIVKLNAHAQASMHGQRRLLQKLRPSLDHGPQPMMPITQIEDTLILDVPSAHALCVCHHSIREMKLFDWDVNTFFIARARNNGCAKQTKTRTLNVRFVVLQ